MGYLAWLGATVQHRVTVGLTNTEARAEDTKLLGVVRTRLRPSVRSRRVAC
jgi:hypothetical protein